MRRRVRDSVFAQQTNDGVALGEQELEEVLAEVARIDAARVEAGIGSEHHVQLTHGWVAGDGHRLGGVEFDAHAELLREHEVLDGDHVDERVALHRQLGRAGGLDFGGHELHEVLLESQGVVILGGRAFAHFEYSKVGLNMSESFVT